MLFPLLVALTGKKSMERFFRIKFESHQIPSSFLVPLPLSSSRPKITVANMLVERQQKRNKVR